MTNFVNTSIFFDYVQVAKTTTNLPPLGGWHQRGCTTRVIETNNKEVALTTSKKTVMVGVYEVSTTEKLREAFAKIHRSVSASKSTDEQFSHEVQHALLLACRTALGKEPSTTALKDREDDLCELMHYLASHRVPACSIIEEVRLFSHRTIGLTKQLRFQQDEVFGRKSDPLSFHQDPSELRFLNENELKVRLLPSAEVVFKSPAVPVAREAVMA